MTDQIELRDIKKIYESDAVPVHALRGVSLDISRGEFVALVGPSGSGKTTLLNMIGGLDRPTSGDVRVFGSFLNQLNETEMTDFRLNQVGFIFQAYNLIPVLSAEENVEFVMELQGRASSERKVRALEMLEHVGLKSMSHRRPGELSGGQQQRVAIARALASQPALILADEPTANLDSTTARELLSLMETINKEDGVTFIFSTHDPLVMGFARRKIHLQDGTIVKDERV